MDTGNKEKVDQRVHRGLQIEHTDARDASTRNLDTSSVVNRSLAPLIMIILLCPSTSTVMGASPVHMVVENVEDITSRAAMYAPLLPPHATSLALLHSFPLSCCYISRCRNIHMQALLTRWSISGGIHVIGTYSFFFKVVKVITTERICSNLQTITVREESTLNTLECQYVYIRFLVRYLRTWSD